MFCNKCGTQLPDGTKFCKNCGAPQPAVPQAQPNYGPPQGHQQPGYGMPPQPQYSAPQPQYSAPQGHQQTQYAARPAGNAQNAAKLILMIAILMAVGMLIACIFKGTIFNVERGFYKGGGRDGELKKYVEPITMDNYYFAAIKYDGFGDFDEYLEEKGMESTTTYVALTAAAAMAVLVLISAILAVIGKHSSAGKTAGIAAFISAIPHGMYLVLCLFLQSKDEYENVKLSIMPVGMIAAGVLIGAFCIAAAKSMKNTASAPAEKAWR
ncbi:MAG: zinc-ribbon domain-containing protein [Ruminococcus sp.]|nr:zinc-ribbon domain-containing protein [Ruminococcus sp.]